MSITKKSFSELSDGTKVDCYVLDNQNGVCAEILTYGGIVKNLYVKNQDGTKTDVALGRDSLEEYQKNEGYFGALIGRHANRIENGTFNLSGTDYHVVCNEGKNSLHGGNHGFNQYVWKAEEAGTDEEPTLILHITSPDGDEGFPGELSVTVTYTVTRENALKIHYEAVSDKDTVCNLTNHLYFNLSGHNSGTVDGQILQMNCAYYTPNTGECMPNGEILSVMGTPFDFRVPKPIGQDIESDFEQIAMFGGYDHNFVIAGEGYRLAAIASSLDTGITMEVYTNKPGIQLYTGNGIEQGRICKEKSEYPVHGGFCLETQYFPNSMKHSHFQSPVLKAGETYDFTTEYRFHTK